MDMTKIGLVATEGADKFMRLVNKVLCDWNNVSHEKGSIVKSKCPRFGSGEGKGLIEESIREKDLYMFVDVMNSSISYKMNGMQNRMSPDDHFADLKRLIGACNNKAKNITVIMPFLYEGRQHRRNGRESLDCAMMLHELADMGIKDIVTFDAHDSRVQNATPLNSFENVRSAYQMISSVLRVAPDIELDNQKLVIVSPDEGATDRAIYLAGLLKVGIGMFYKRRDYTKIVDGRNPILAHEFIGEDLHGKDAIVIDDMISSGDSMIDVAKQLKKRGAKRVIICATFGLFTNGLERFDAAVEEGLIHKVFTTNLIWQKPELFSRDYYVSVPMQEYVAALIESLHNGKSLSSLIDPSMKIKKLADAHRRSAGF